MERLEHIAQEVQNTAIDYVGDTFSFLNECLPASQSIHQVMTGFVPVFQVSNENKLSKIKNFDMESNAGFIEKTKIILAQLDAEIQKSLKNYNHKYQYSPLHSGVILKDIDRFKNIILSNSGFIDSVDHNGRTPLFLAVITGNNEAVKALIEAGADVNICGHEAKSPLFIAVALSRADLVKLLLENKAQINTADDHGLTPLHIAAFTGNIEIFKLLSSENRLLINLQDVLGRTALHLAALSGQSFLVSVLTRRGAAVSIQDLKGRLPLHYAVIQDNEISVKSLLFKNMICQTDMHGRDAYFYACLFNRQNLIRILLANGLVPDNQDGNGLSVSQRPGRVPQVTEAD